jgi:hypothetical protein
MQFTGIAVNTNTSSVSAVVGTAGLLPVYKDTSGSPALLTGGEIVATCAFGLLYDSALNSSNGGFHLMQITGAGGGGGGTDYFATSETLTTGASPVDIDPAVFLTKIVSGGTAGIEVVNFPDYTFTQAGKPHLVIFDTQTDPADVIHVTGTTNIIGSPYGPGVKLGDFGSQSAIYSPTLMAMDAVNQGFNLTWGNNAWVITGLVDNPTITYEMASEELWGPPPPDGRVPGILFQDTDGTLNMVMDPTNPQFEITITASTDSLNPARIPGGVRSVVINSTGLGGPGYIHFDGPAIVPDDLGATNIQKVVRANIVAGGDTIVSNDGYIRNWFNRNTVVTFSSTGEIAVCHWDNVWILESQTNCTTVPLVCEPLQGINGTAYANNANTTISIPAGYVIGGITFSNSAAHAVTGGVKIGTTSGAADVVAAQPVGSNGIGKIPDASLLLTGFSSSADQLLYIQPVTSWNGAVISFYFVLFPALALF